MAKIKKLSNKQLKKIVGGKNVIPSWRLPLFKHKK